MNAEMQHQAHPEAMAKNFLAWSRKKILSDKSKLSWADIDAVISQEAENYRSEQAPLPLVENTAAFIGERFIKKFGGEWAEDETYGMIISSFQGKDSGFDPFALSERAWEIGERNFLGSFFSAVPKRLSHEKKIRPEWTEAQKKFREILNGKELDNGSIVRIIEVFRDNWEACFGRELPLSLIGLKELDKYLQSHYILNFLSIEELIAAGLYTGEIGRQLFGGEWIIPESKRSDRIALRYPELDYFPVGRIFKMMTEKPEKEPLDEYIRLIPSARKELRESGVH